VGHVEVKQDVPVADILSAHLPWPLVEDVEDGDLSLRWSVRADTVRARPDARQWHKDYVRAALHGGFQVPLGNLREYNMTRDLITT